ncbi:MAG TPA: hypothetical protein VFT13_08180 [Candidatus Krumholzibacteria bacterium]|nr:hypothetical protein [Candidatus Krumholzibacteria bacterium]
MVAEPAVVVARLARVLQDLGIPYVIGGSFASSLYGIPRATHDVDIVADLRAEHVEPMASALAGEFHADTRVMRDAIRDGSSFNILHEATMFKADIFMSPDDAWSRERLARARTEQLETGEGPVSIRFSSPEDTLLHKLVWYRLGNEVSDRQWTDAVGLLRIQRDHLDAAYLDRWAPELGVSDLLERARARAGDANPPQSGRTGGAS